MDKFLEIYRLPRPNQGEIENMDRQLICTEIETVILKLPTNEGPGLDDFIGKFYQTFREESTPVLLKLFQKVAVEPTHLNSSYEATITLVPKPDKDTTKKEKYRPV